MYTPPPMMTRLAELRIDELTAEARQARLHSSHHVPLRVRTLTMAARALRVNHHVHFDAPSTIQAPMAPSAR